MKMPFWPCFAGYRDIDLGLNRVEDLLARLGNPHKKLPPIIHIAGTNGKGSTLSFLREIFTQNNYQVSCYTSPHLVSFNERIVINGNNIDDNFLNECLKACKIKAEENPKIAVTFFEGITVAAFLAFSRVKSDIILLETGMGGRLDATNIIKDNLFSIITPIAFDHQDFLGNTLAKIAFEKAGIMKKNCPVIIAKQKLSVLQTLENQASKLNCSKYIFGKDFSARILKNSWIYKNKNIELNLPLPNLAGRHQIENAATAITAILAQKKFTIDVTKIAQALKNTKWQARLQKIDSGKFYKKLPANFTLILDGSHNPQGSKTIAEFLKQHKNKKIFVIFAMLKDKNCIKFLKNISNKIDEIICLTIPNESKSRDKSEIAKIAQNLKIKTEIANNFDDAFKKILQQKIQQESLILICGSLYLAGKFLEENAQ